MRFRLIFAASLLAAVFGGGADAAQDSGISRLAPTVLASDFAEVSPFSLSTPSPLGRLAASGYSVATPLPLAIPLLPDAQAFRSVENLLIDDQVLPGVELNLGYNAMLSGRFSQFGSGASAGLFISAVATDAPYAALTDGGSYAGSTIVLADGLHLRFGQSVLDPQVSQYQIPVFSYLAQLSGPHPQYDLRRAEASVAGLDWDVASWAGVGVVATHAMENNDVLGGFSPSAIAVARSANTSALGVSAHLGLGDGWITTLSYNEGITRLNLRSDAFIAAPDTLHSRAYGFAIAKRGLFGDEDSLGLAVSRPLQIYAGSSDFSTNDVVDANSGRLDLGTEYTPLANATPETDLELGYVTSFMDGALALQANAGYQMNVAGLGGQNSLSVISRAKINF